MTSYRGQIMLRHRVSERESWSTFNNSENIHTYTHIHICTRTYRGQTMLRHRVSEQKKKRSTTPKTYIHACIHTQTHTYRGQIVLRHRVSERETLLNVEQLRKHTYTHTHIHTYTHSQKHAHTHTAARENILYYIV
jgi:hypothetical protein